jgi:hypothetical protein
MSKDDKTARPGGGLRAGLARWVPWLVTVAVFIYVFHRVPVDKVFEAAVRVNLWIFVPLLVGDVAFHFFWDALVHTYLFRWFGTGLTYRGMLAVRGASYLLALLNFFMGQGGLALLMNRWKNLSLSRATSVIIFNIFNDYFLLLAFCLAGAFRLPDVDLACFIRAGEEGDLVRFIVISWAFFALHLMFYRWFLPRVDGWERIKNNELLSTFNQAPVMLYFKLGIIKSPSFFVGIIVQYFALMAFDIRVPLLHMMVMIPIVWLIGAIPVTVMGLGTMQAAMIWLVARFAEGSGGPGEIEAAVVAFSLLWTISYNLGLFVTGAVCVSRLPRSIWMPEGKSGAEQ